MGICFSSQPRQPDVVPTDDIIPLRFWDTAKSMRGTVLDISLKFDDVLDIAKIRDALDDLFEIEGWKQLGARIRMNNGKLEYHVPASFDASRPAYHLTISNHKMSIHDHDLGKKFPKAGNKGLMFNTPDDLSPHLRSAESPTKIDDWLYTDRPQLSIHAVKFEDATVLTVTWIHTLADVMGIKTFLNAWTAILRRDEKTVPKLRSLRSDPLSELGQCTPAERYIYFDRVFGRKDFLWFIGLNILERILHRQEERRMICLPASSMKHLHSRAMADVENITSVKEKSTLFVSESDVLLAWWVHTLNGAMGLRASQPIMVNNALNLRTSPEDIFDSANDVYMGNALCMCPTFFQGSQLADESLGQIALRIRQSLAQQRSTEQVEAMTALQMQTMEKTGYLALVGDPRMVLLSCSNWHKARLYDIDFAPAIVPSTKSESEGRQTSPGKPSYVNGVQHSSISFRNVMSVVGKDSAGNWWFTGVLRTSIWAQAQEQLDLIEMVEHSKSKTSDS
ncbi:Transferase [Penicillium fimorum]|uniref:Transferase n=1 Tax=Penicillium fimorum TaxID=1882269 RepID=A0A9X0C0J6_9EURO|nr:Transferase [Penicillium fimorum]